MIFTKFAQYSHYSGIGLNHCFLGESFRPYLMAGYTAVDTWDTVVRSYQPTRWKPTTTTPNYISIAWDSNSVPCVDFNSGYPSQTAFLRLYSMTYPYPKMSQRDLFGVNKSFSIQMTCTYEEFANYRGIMGLGRATAGETGVILGQYQNGNLVWGIFPYTTSSNSVWVSVPQAQIPSGKFNWCFIYDKDANTTGGAISLYINNIHKGTVALTGGAPNFSTNIGDIYGVSLGHAYHDANRFMKGKIYSLLVYETAITQEEFTNNYMIDKMKYLIPN